MSYVKLDTSILSSTLWLDRDARDVFLTALLLAEPREVRTAEPVYRVDAPDSAGWSVPPGWYGFVRASGPGLVALARLDLVAGLAALERLCAPDPYSRTPDRDGRRLARIEGGYLVLNFVAYRERDHSTARVQEWRRRRRLAGDRNGNETDETVGNGRETAGNGGATHETANETQTDADAYIPPPPPARARAKHDQGQHSATDTVQTARDSLPPEYQPDYDALIRGSPCPEAVAREVAVTATGRSPTAEGATPDDVGRGIRALLLAGASRVRLGRYVRTAMLQRTQPFAVPPPRSTATESEYEILARRYEAEEASP